MQTRAFVSEGDCNKSTRDKDVWKQGQGPLKVRVLEGDGTWEIRAFEE